VRQPFRGSNGCGGSGRFILISWSFIGCRIFNLVLRCPEEQPGKYRELPSLFQTAAFKSFF